jgi:hypothetical protein
MDLYKIAQNWDNTTNVEKEFLKEKCFPLLPKWMQNEKDLYTFMCINEGDNDEFRVEFLSECHICITKDLQMKLVEWPCECGPDGC